MLKGRGCRRSEYEHRCRRRANYNTKGESRNFGARSGKTSALRVDEALQQRLDASEQRFPVECTDFLA